MTTPPANPPARPPASGWPPNVEPFYRPCLIAALAASVGVVLGSISPWISIVLFTVTGLDVGNWGAVCLFLGVLAGASALIVLLFDRTPFAPQWALALGWVVAVAGIACLSMSLPIVLRVMTLPRGNLFGVSIGPGTGWGLWLLVFSAAVLAVTGTIVATQLAKHTGPPDAWSARWRRSATAVALVIVFASVGYFAGHWDSGLDIRTTPSTAMPSFPSFPSPFSPETTSSTSMAEPTMSTTATTITSEQIHDFQAAMDAVYDEMQSALTSLKTALDSHDEQGLQAGCASISKISNDVRNAIPQPIPQMQDNFRQFMDKLPRAATEFTAAQRDCEALSPYSTAADLVQFHADFDRATDDVTFPKSP